MNIKKLTRACVFSLSLSFIGFSSSGIKAELSGESMQAAQIATRMKIMVINLITSGDIKHLTMAQTYIASLNPNDPLVAKLLVKIRASWDALMVQLKATRRLTPSRIEAHLIAAFDKFGDELLALSKEVADLGLGELALVFAKIPQEVKQEFDGMSLPQKTRFGTNIWRAKL